MIADTAKTPITKIPGANVGQLLQNVSAGIGDCKKKGFRNAYEVGRFGVTSDQPATQATESIDDLQNLLRTKLGLTKADLTSGKLDAATRQAIIDFRKKSNIDTSLGDQVDSKLFTELMKGQ